MKEKESLSNIKADEQADFMNLCQNNYDRIKSEIVSAICEGVEKGLRDGITEGVLCGLEDCLCIGFLNVSDAHNKSFEEIMEEVALEFVENEVKDRVKKETCPALKRCTDKSCERVIQEIKKEQEKAARNDIYWLRKMHIERICEEKADEIKEDVKKKIPNDFISVALFGGMLEAISDCMVEAVKNCTERIYSLTQDNKSV